MAARSPTPIRGRAPIFTGALIATTEEGLSKRVASGTLALSDVRDEDYSKLKAKIIGVSLAGSSTSALATTSPVLVLMLGTING